MTLQKLLEKLSNGRRYHYGELAHSWMKPHASNFKFRGDISESPAGSADLFAAAVRDHLSTVVR